MKPQPMFVLILDDLLESIQEVSYAPFLDELYATRLPFMSQTACSATRAAVESGLYPIRSRNGVGSLFTPNAAHSLMTGPWMLARRIRGAGSVSQVGKWHLCRHDDLAHRGWPEAGYDDFGGSQANLGDYFLWSAVVNGSEQLVSRYATDWTAARAVSRLEAGDRLVVCALNADHRPFHYPPGEYGDGSEADMRRAMREYLDRVVARLVNFAESLGYAVMVFSDNGGTTQDGGKKNLDHLTITPLLALRGFPSVFPVIVDCTDLHATIVHAATGEVPQDTDGISLLDPTRMRTVAFADLFDGIDGPGNDHVECASDGVLKLKRVVATGELIPSTWEDEPTTSDTDFLLQALDERRDG